MLNNPLKRLGRTRPRLTRRLRLTMFLAVAILLLAPVTVFAVNGFTDVPPTHPHYQGVNYLVAKNLTTGYPDNTFRPENNLTRGQMGTFLYRASGNDPATPPSVNADMVDGLDAGQLAAAGVHVTHGNDNLPVIEKSFNNVNGVTPTVTGTDGSYIVDLGFPTSNRFVVATVEAVFANNVDSFITTTAPPAPGDTVRVRVYDISVGGLAAADFFLLVYGG